jgi:hypothetical protein
MNQRPISGNIYTISGWQTGGKQGVVYLTHREVELISCTAYKTPPLVSIFLPRPFVTAAIYLPGPGLLARRHPGAMERLAMADAQQREIPAAA